MFFFVVFHSLGLRRIPVYRPVHFVQPGRSRNQRQRQGRGQGPRRQILPVLGQHSARVHDVHMGVCCRLRGEVQHYVGDHLRRLQLGPLPIPAAVHLLEKRSGRLPLGLPSSRLVTPSVDFTGFITRLSRSQCTYPVLPSFLLSLFRV